MIFSTLNKFVTSLNDEINKKIEQKIFPFLLKNTNDILLNSVLDKNDWFIFKTTPNFSQFYNFNEWKRGTKPKNKNSWIKDEFKGSISVCDAPIGYFICIV